MKKIKILESVSVIAIGILVCSLAVFSVFFNEFGVEAAVTTCNQNSVIEPTNGQTITAVSLIVKACVPNSTEAYAKIYKPGGLSLDSAKVYPSDLGATAITFPSIDLTSLPNDSYTIYIGYRDSRDNSSVGFTGPTINLVKSNTSFDFSLSATNITIARPPSGANFYPTNTITATLLFGTTQAVSFAQTGFPTGVQPGILPSCNPTCNQVNTLTVYSNAALGTFPIAVKGMSADITKSTTYNLVITDGSTPPPTSTTSTTTITTITPTSTSTTTTTVAPKTEDTKEPETLEKNETPVSTSPVYDELLKAAVSEAIKVLEVNIVSTGKEKGITISGKAEPSSTVYLYIFSDPIVVSVTADGNGDWSYSLDQDLPDGKHEVYVAVKGEDGIIKSRSAVFGFFVGEAIAAAEGDTIGTVSRPNYAIYYVVTTIAVLALVISFIFYVITKGHIKKHEALVAEDKS